MTTRIGVALMAICLVLYFVVTGQQTYFFLTSGEPVAIVMGVALLILPLIGVWALVRELQFGLSADRLGRRLDAEGGMPPADVEQSATGRISGPEADALVERYRDEAAQAPDDWRAAYRSGVVLDAAGRRKDARAAIRTAIAIEKRTR